MSDPTLFPIHKPLTWHLQPPKPPPHNGTPTSKTAADSVADVAWSVRGMVLEAIRNASRGLTCDEAEVILSMRHQTCSARFRELAQAGRIRQQGTRATRSGRQASVYFVTERP